MSAPHALVCALLAAGTAAAQEARTFDDCEARAREHPGAMASYECFADLPRRNNQWDEAGQRLEAHLARDPQNHLARFALGALESSRAHDRAEPLLLEAAAGLAGQQRHVEEVRARLTLSVFLQIRGRDDDSEEQLARAAETAKATGDSILQARVWNVEGRQASRRGDFGRSWQLFKQVEAVVFPDGPAGMQAFCLSMLGFLSGGLDRPQQAVGYYRREVEVLRRSGDRWSESRALVNLSQQAVKAWDRGDMEHEAALLAGREALDAAKAAGARDVVGLAHISLGHLAAGPEAGGHFAQALAAYRSVKAVDGIGAALRGLGYYLAASGTDPKQGEALLDEALALATSTGDLDEIAGARIVRGTLRLETGRPEEARAEFEEAFDAVESLRDRQPDDTVRARVFSPWVFAYQRLAGALLEIGGTPEVARAVSIIERMRARVLLEALDVARATAAITPDVPARRRRAEALDAIARAQQRLVAPALPAAERKDLLVELERRELEEQEARSEMARADPSFAAVRGKGAPTLDQLQAALAPDEAMLSFLVSRPGAGGAVPGDEGRGSWLLVHTRARTGVYPLPDTRELESAVALFVGLLERRDGSETGAAAGLYRTLLARPLSDLPPAVTRLVLVLDGPLHRLPFAALSAGPRDPPLTARWRVSLVPSAALWLRWRRGPAVTAAAPALVLADPDTPVVAAGAAPERQWSLTLAERLGRLPHARAEGRAVRRSLGGGSQVFAGREASERRLKETDLRRFSLLHLAAHAVLDDERPERSAVLLAPGGAEEDGLLQIREVVELDLEGRVVVLSACRSASGPLLPGEGPLGLARGFFQAGARTVVGSLWALRDDEAESFFGAFYRSLARGHGVAAALAEAQGEQRRALVPAAAWAGVVALGDGDAVPAPGGRRGAGRSLVIAGCVAIVVLALPLALRWRARRRRALG